jgi:NAD-dependent dihydropyrimidine dehydrogenase PreA subunit
LPYFITSACIGETDMSCVEECPVDCIYEGDRKLYINPRECIDCGACEAVCPVDAIVGDKTTGAVPDEAWEHKQDNAVFFSVPLPGRATPLGNPGGAAKVGRVGMDTALTNQLAESM